VPGARNEAIPPHLEDELRKGTLMDSDDSQTRSLEDLVRRSQLIFLGTIEQLQAATMSRVPVTPNTAIVHVQEVVWAPQTLADPTGRDITVHLNTTERAATGQEAVFFVASWLYGESLAVVEVGRIAARGDLTDLRRRIAQARQRSADQLLHGRIARAVLVVAGRVSQTRPVPAQQQPQIITEHAPDWWEAVIAIGSVEKGHLSQENLTILFPHSSDNAWIDSPKLSEGQDGIWILQRDQQERGWPLLRLPGLTALDPLDFQPANQVGRIRTLIQRGQDG